MFILASVAKSIDDAEDADAGLNRRSWSFFERHGLLLVCISPVIANLIGSAFNIFYNSTQIEKLLTDAQQLRFAACWQVYNGIIYPVAIFCFVLPLFWLRPTHRALLRGEAVAPERMKKAQRYVINLPWVVSRSDCCRLVVLHPCFSVGSASLA